jgi:hypothetical protein
MTTYNTLLSLGQFKLHEYIFSQFQNRKLARNSVALLHALLAVIQNLLHISTPNPKLYNLCKAWSSGYFLWDMLFIFQHEKLNILRLAYIYHHIVSIYIVNQPPNLYFGDKILFWGEFSNIPSYFVYYYLHKDPKNKKLKTWLYLQKWLYAFIRIPILGNILINAWQTAPNKFPIAIVSPVYLMGVIWTYKLFTPL